MDDQPRIDVPSEPHRLTVLASAASKAWLQHLPLSVRYAAARAADAVVQEWHDQPVDSQKLPPYEDPGLAGDMLGDSARRLPPWDDLKIAQPVPLLSRQEHEAIDLLGKVANLLTSIIGRGPTRAHDIDEAFTLIHGLQRMVGSQAAARSFSDRYRLLGETLARDPKVYTCPCGAQWRLTGNPRDDLDRLVAHRDTAHHHENVPPGATYPPLPADLEPIEFIGDSISDWMPNAPAVLAAARAKGIPQGLADDRGDQIQAGESEPVGPSDPRSVEDRLSVFPPSAPRRRWLRRRG